jgi:hypothetical protein
MSPEEYNKLMNQINFDKLFYDHTGKEYFIPLLEKLKNAKI